MSFCKRAKATVKKALAFIDDKLTDALNAALSVTSVIKKVTENPLFKITLTALPPINGFNPFQVVQIINDSIEKIEDISKCRELSGIDKINCYLQQIQGMPKEKQNSILIKLKSLIAEKIDGKRFAGAWYDTAAQVNYLIAKNSKDGSTNK